ncbi:MAG TPA: AI-2E family transporter [Gemmatimonadales bacterium]|jgi:predicted PurR-regulated permease PerM
MPRDPQRRFALVLVAILGVALLIGVLPYAGGLLAAPVLAILWDPLRQRLVRRLPVRVAAWIVLILTLILIVIPGIWLLSVLVVQAQNAVEALASSALLARLDEEIRLGGIQVGPSIAGAGQAMLTWIGTNAFSLLGTATRFVLSLLFTLVGLYYLLVRPGAAWNATEPYLPFSPERTAALRDRFEAVTWSTVVGTGLNAVVQGLLVGLAFRVLGLPNVAFWGAVTAVLSILPLVGSGLVWGPAALSLLLDGRAGAAAAMTIWGAVVIANVDNLLRPIVYRRYAHMHPMVTLVGAVIGVRYFGLVGLVLGPLGIQYFLELVVVYRAEYEVAGS